METEEQMRAAVAVVGDFRRKFEKERLDTLRNQFGFGGVAACRSRIWEAARPVQIYEGVFDAFDDVVEGYNRAVKRLRLLQDDLVARLYLYYPKAKEVGK